MNKTELKNELIKMLEDTKSDLADISRDFYGDFKDYLDGGYICDNFTDYADSACDIYTGDLLEWAKYNFEEIEEALDELGTPTDSHGRADFLKIIQQGQFVYNDRQLHADAENIIFCFGVNYIIENLDEKDDNFNKSEDDLEEFFDNLRNIDTNDKLEDILNTCEDFLTVEE